MFVFFYCFQILFSFFEKELDKKWVKKYEIFLWNYQTKFYTTTETSLYSIFIHLQIFVNGNFDEKLTEEILEIYSQTWWNVNEEKGYWKYITFLVDKFSSFFTFDITFSQSSTSSIIDLWNNYFYFYDFSTNNSQWGKSNNICKY